MEQLSSSQRVLSALQEARARIDALQQARHEPIAIIGIGCRFPGGVRHPESFWQLLQQGVDAISEIPSDRWDVEAYYDPDPEMPGKMYTRFGGFLQALDQFDPQFFGISPREAIGMDPQQRLLLETSWEALEQAGGIRDRLQGSPTGVFVGITSSDYERIGLERQNVTDFDIYSLTGNACNIAAGRVAYVFGLQGPCIAVDTACSSSSVAIHLACQSLRNRECDLALAGGVNIILWPQGMVSVCRTRALAVDGRCKTFDARADGYGRSEGCGMLALKRLSDAQAAGDTILALIRGSAVNHDGPSSGLTTPNGPMQAAVIRQALKQARVEPAQIQYIEAHGTGTQLGDPIELHALGEVFGEGRDPSQPLLVGSVKTNIGHTESASGVAGVIKVVLALLHRAIPPHLHFQQPNLHILWNTLPVKVPTTLLPWEATGEPRRAGVSSFGFSGTNAHLILEEAPASMEGITHHRVMLPTSPFQRQRYWIDPPSNAMQQKQRQIQPHSREAQLRPDGESFAEWLYTVDWRRKPLLIPGLLAQQAPALDELEHKLSVRMAQVFAPEFTHHYETVVTELEALCLEYVIVTLYDLGWPFPQACRFSIAELAVQTRVIPAYHRLLQRLCAMLAEAGIIKSVEGQWEAIASPAVPNLKAQVAGLRRQYPKADAELTLLDRCGTRLADVLRGQCPPLPLLFPENDPVSAAYLYQDAPGAQAANLLLREVIQSLCTSLAPQQPLRVLEVGAGTGGSTATILPHLPPDLTTYTFTDISLLFVAQAKKKFQTYSWIEYRVLDIEQSPLQQGFDPGAYDLILAANVLHATRDLRESVQHVRQLLAPGGVLLLLEGTAQLRFIDLIFGLAEGWWRFADQDVRATHPLLSAAQWTALLHQQGFAQAAALASGREDCGLLAKQAVIAAYSAVEQVHEEEQPGQWVVVSNSQEQGRHMRDLLQSRGNLCRLALSGSGYERLSDWEFRFAPDRLEDLRRVLATIQTSSAPLRGVIQIGDGPENSDGKEDLAEGERLCQTTLHLVQALLQANLTPLPSFWLMTHGAVRVTDEIPDWAGVWQAPLWGVGKSLRLEQPELPCICLDLDTATDLDVIGDELAHWDGEDQIAYRTGQRYVPRLVRHTPDVADLTGTLPILAENTYLISGGLGGLGLYVARWLAENGAQHLVLLSRREPDAQARAQIDAIQQIGAHVRVMTADVTDCDRMRQILAEIAQTPFPLRGIIHAAGVLEDGILAQLSWERFRQVLQPKINGAWHLHTLTQDLHLDWFVLFSSSASLLGSAGQSNHAAANAFLDALSHVRRAHALPAISINWGAWSEIGAAAKHQVEERVRFKGMNVIPPSQGIRAFDYILRLKLTQTGVIPLNWSIIAHQVSSQVSPFLGEMLAEAKRDLPAPEPLTRPESILNQVHAALSAERRDLIAKYLQAQTAEVLRLEVVDLNPRQPLNTLGLDSLMAIELRNRIHSGLEVDVPLSKFLEGLGTDAITNLVLSQFSQVDRTNEAVKPSAQPERFQPINAKAINPQQARELLSKLDQLSDAELDALLQASVEE